MNQVKRGWVTSIKLSTIFVTSVFSYLKTHIEKMNDKQNMEPHLANIRNQLWQIV